MKNEKETSQPVIIIQKLRVGLLWHGVPAVPTPAAPWWSQAVPKAGELREHGTIQTIPQRP